MIEFLELRPNTGSPLELNTLSYPCQVFDPNGDFEDKKFKKMQQPGEHPTFVYPPALYIAIEGDIVGTGATPTADFNTKRFALINASGPPITATGVLTARKHGVLRIRLDGMTENADADFLCVSRSVPLSTEFWSVNEFRLSLKISQGYFVGVTSAATYLLG